MIQTNADFLLEFRFFYLIDPLFLMEFFRIESP